MAPHDLDKALVPWKAARHIRRIYIDYRSREKLLLKFNIRSIPHLLIPLSPTPNSLIHLFGGYAIPNKLHNHP